MADTSGDRTMAQTTTTDRCPRCRLSKRCAVHGTESASNPAPGIKRLMWLLTISPTEFECRESWREAEAGFIQ